jgi:site-specific DNA recombinase
MKTEYSTKLDKLEAILSAHNYNHVDIKDLLDKGIKNLLKLDNLYETADIEKRREIISSMYPEKMTLNGFSFRTSRINEAARMIYSLDEGYSENKDMTNGNNSSLSCQVGMTGFEPAAPTSRT